MKKIFVLTIFVTSGAFLFAQNTHLFAGGGLMNYQGDLQARRVTLSQANPYFSLGVYYEATAKLYFRGGIVSGKVSADDKKEAQNKLRNLSFTSQVLEFHAGAEYDLINSYEHTLTPYVFAALAVFRYNPYTQDASNTRVYLQPLGTEGQGYGGRSKYSLTQLAIPFGGGLKIAVNDNIFIRLEAVLRRLNTDYLDDVSTVYAEQNELITNNGQLAADFAFRGDELSPPLSYPAVPNAIRGNPKSKDFYYTAGASVSFRLGTGNGGGGGGNKGKLGCPVNVY